MRDVEGGLIHLLNFLPFLSRGTTFVTSCLLSSYQVPSEKESTLKGKNLLPGRANSFLLE